MKNIVLFLSSVSSIPDYADSGKVTAPTATTGSDSFDCQGMLRSGYGFITKDFFGVFDTTANKESAVGVACDTATAL